jgi:hypothetical protein
MPGMITPSPCVTIFAERLRWLVLALSLLIGSSSWAAEAGRFLYVHGSVRITATDGAERKAQQGEALHESETVSTGMGSWAQLRMKDAALIALRPDTVFKVEAYQFNGTEDGSERGLLRLVKGGFRTLTGAIGKTHRDRYRVATETSTIGIRGTDHEPVYIPASGGWSGAPDAEPGTYDKVNSGATYIETQAGRIELGPNQAGYVPPRVDAVPTRLERMPDFYRPQPMTGSARPGGQTEGKQQEGKSQEGKPQEGKQAGSGQPQGEGKQQFGGGQQQGEGKQQQLGGDSQQFDGKPQGEGKQQLGSGQQQVIGSQSIGNKAGAATGTIIQPGAILPVQNASFSGNINPVPSSGATLLPALPLGSGTLGGGTLGTLNTTIQPVPNNNVTVTETLVAAPEGYALAGGDKSGNLMGAGAGMVGNGDTMNVMLGANGNPVLVAKNSDNLTYTRNGAAAVQIGKLDFDGTTVRWGIYAGGKIVDQTAGQRAAEFFHFMGAGQALPQSALPGFSGQYSTVQAFTSPITEAGWRTGTGNVTTSIIINNGTLTSLNLGVSDWQGRQWSASSTTPTSFAQFVSSGIKVGGSVDGSPLNALSSKVTGIPVGATGSGLIGSYILRGSDNTKAVTGSFLAR